MEGLEVRKVENHWSTMILLLVYLILALKKQTNKNIYFHCMDKLPKDILPPFALCKKENTAKEWQEDEWNNDKFHNIKHI